MVRAVALDSRAEAQLKALATDAPQVGVLAGRAGGGRDLLLDCVRTPERDGLPAVSLSPQASGAARSSGMKAQGGATLSLDQDWLIEHAAQVSRLLPGGLSVRGLYIVSPEAAMAASANTLALLLREITADQGPACPADLLVHVDAVSGKIAVKEVPSAQQGTSLQPCELRVSDICSQLVTLNAWHEVSQALHWSDRQAELLEGLNAALEREVQARVRPSAALFNGKLPAQEQQVADIVGTASTLSAEVVCPAAASLAVPGSKSSGSGGSAPAAAATAGPGGTIRLQGSLQCCAVVHRRESVASALEALRADMEQSLRLRVELAAEAVELLGREEGKPSSGSSTEKPAQAGAQVVVTLPRRVLMDTAGALSLPYSDYLAQGEGVEAAQQRLAEVLGPSKLRHATLKCAEPVWQAAGSGAGGTAAAAQNNMIILTACLALLIAVLLAAWFSLQS